MAGEEPRNYFILIQLSGPPNRARIADAAPKIKNAIELAAREKDYVFAYASHDGSSMGILMRTTLAARQIRSRIDSPGRTPGPYDDLDNFKSTPDALFANDSILVLEVGPDFTGKGFSKAWSWLQHR